MLCLDAAVGPSGQPLLASAGKDHSLRIWDVTTGTCLASATGHSAAVGALAFSRRGCKFVVTGASDRTLKYWTLEKLFAGGGVKSQAVVAAHDKDINAVAIAPNDSLACTGSQVSTGIKPCASISSNALGRPPNTLYQSRRFFHCSRHFAAPQGDFKSEKLEFKGALTWFLVYSALSWFLHDVNMKLYAASCSFFSLPDMSSAVSRIGRPASGGCPSSLLFGRCEATSGGSGPSSSRPSIRYGKQACLCSHENVWFASSNFEEMQFITHSEGPPYTMRAATGARFVRVNCSYMDEDDGPFIHGFVDNRPFSLVSLTTAQQPLPEQPLS